MGGLHVPPMTTEKAIEGNTVHRYRQVPQLFVFIFLSWCCELPRHAWTVFAVLSSAYCELSRLLQGDPPALIISILL